MPMFLVTPVEIETLYAESKLSVFNAEVLVFPQCFALASAGLEILYIHPQWDAA